MRNLVGTPDVPGQNARYFNGKTNIDFEALEDIGLLSFGMKHLSSTPIGVRNALLDLYLTMPGLNAYLLMKKPYLYQMKIMNLFLLKKLLQLKLSFNEEQESTILSPSQEHSR